MNFKYYHFHIYFKEEQYEELQNVLEQLQNLEGIKIGRAWKVPVGPHPIGSCQITVPLGMFEKMSQWFLNNKKSLDVFVHAVSGDDLKDHTDYTMWIGNQHKLNLDFFTKQK